MKRGTQFKTTYVITYVVKKPDIGITGSMTVKIDEAPDSEAKAKAVVQRVHPNAEILSSTRLNFNQQRLTEIRVDKCGYIR